MPLMFNYCGQIYNEASALEWPKTWDEMLSSSEASVAGAFGGLNTNGNYNFYGLPNMNDGITGYVTKYVGINRNTNHPELAFSLLDVLFSDEILSGKGFVVEEAKYVQTISEYVSYFG